MTCIITRCDYMCPVPSVDCCDHGKGIPEVPAICPNAASGSSTLGMLVEMLVERVFLVSGVVKTVFCRFKKKRFFVVFHHKREACARRPWRVRDRPLCVCVCVCVCVMCYVLCVCVCVCVCLCVCVCVY